MLNGWLVMFLRMTGFFCRRANSRLALDAHAGVLACVHATTRCVTPGWTTSPAPVSLTVKILPFVIWYGVTLADRLAANAGAAKTRPPTAMSPTMASAGKGRRLRRGDGMKRSQRAPPRPTAETPSFHRAAGGVKPAGFPCITGGRLSLGGGAAAQQLPPAVLVDLGGDGVLDEVDQDVDEPVRIGAVREVPGPLEHLEPAAGDRLLCCHAVLDGDDPVVLAPHDQGRELGGEVEPVDRADALASAVH